MRDVGEHQRHVASVHRDGSESGPAQVAHLRNGEAIHFGYCVCGECELEVRLDLAGVFGRLSVDAQICAITNLSRHATFVMWDLEDPRQRLRIPAGRAAVPVPFELARIGVVGTGDAGILTIFGPEPVEEANQQVVACSGGTPPPPLNPGATYYAVLRTLRDAWNDPHRKRLPTSAEVASKLRRGGLAITSRAVDHHIDYLIRRVRLDQPCHTGGQRRKREALVEMCIAQGWLE